MNKLFVKENKETILNIYNTVIYLLPFKAFITSSDKSIYQNDLLQCILSPISIQEAVEGKFLLLQTTS